jgi:hypothetical protein
MGVACNDDKAILEIQDLGVTKTRGFLHSEQNVLNPTQNSLCRAVNRWRGRCARRASNR